MPIMVGIELRNYATVHKMSNQHKPGSPRENWSLPTTSQLHLFCTARSLFRWLSQSCDSYAAAFCCRDVGPNGPNNKHELGRTLATRCQYNFNSGILASGKTRMAPKPSKTTTAWWLASNSDRLCQWSWSVTSTIWKEELPQHKPGSPWENWSLPTTSQLHDPACCPNTAWVTSHYGLSHISSHDSTIRSCLDRTKLESVDAQMDQIARKSTLLPWKQASCGDAFASTTSEPTGFPRVSGKISGWLASQAKLPLPWWLASNSPNLCALFMKPSHQQSVQVEGLPQRWNSGSSWENVCRYLQLRRFTYPGHSWWLSQSCDSYAAAFCCRDVGPNGPNNRHGFSEHLWHVASTTSTLASSRVARLGLLPSQATLPRHDGWRRTWQMCQWPWNVKSTIS